MNAEHGRGKELLFAAEQIAVATHTLYRGWYPEDLSSDADTDKVRGDLALAMFRRAIRNGNQLVVADGGSSDAFIGKVRELATEGRVTFLSDVQGGRAPQRRAAFVEASRINGVQAILYTQPEKNLLGEEELKMIFGPIARREADIVIPARDPELFQESYPRYMYESELYVNHKYNCVLQGVGLLASEQNFDWFFGPIAFRNHPDVLSLFLKRYDFEKQEGVRFIRRHANPEMRSNGHYFPVVEALYRGLRVASVAVPFVYPNKQRENEEFGQRKNFLERRSADRYGYLVEFVQFVKYLEGQRSLIRQVEN